jgi:hypothetical protein
MLNDTTSFFYYYKLPGQWEGARIEEKLRSCIIFVDFIPKLRFFTGSSCVSSLLTGEGRGRAWSRIIRPQERLGLYKSFNPLWLKSLRSIVADPGCLSRIPDPDFHQSQIPDPKTATKERGEKKFVVISFFVATNFTKFKII